MFETIIAADIGSTSTRLASRNTISCRLSRLALDPEDGRRVLAVGDESRKILNATPVYPVRGGAIANTHLAAIMLRRMALDMLGRKSLYGVSLRVAVPTSVSDMQKAAVAETAREAGFRSVKLVDAMLMGAVGAGVDIYSESANMIVDIGHERMNTVLCASGGAVSATTSNIGSQAFDRAIQSYLASERRIIVGARAAENAKRMLDKPCFSINGRCIDTGLAGTVNVGSAELMEALVPTVRLFAQEIASAINKTPPESAADLIDNGVLLIGGGAMRFRLAKQLSTLLGIPVHMAANGEHAVIFGMQSAVWRMGRFMDMRQSSTM